MNPAGQGWRSALFNRRMLICVFTGFASGMPLYVLIQLVPAWLREGGVSLADIGLFALVGIPYTWKFIWAPFIDRVVPPLLGRRRGWMFIFQLALLLSIGALGLFEPQQDIAVIAWFALAVAFFSASQDIVLDAYRREILPDAELGLGNSIHVQAYRISGLVPGALSLILADLLPWGTVFWITAGFMAAGLALTLSISEPETERPPAYGLRESVVAPFREYVQRRQWSGVLLVLGFMFLYKLGDNMATALSTPFYLDLGFSKTQIGAVAKNAALWPSIIGGLLGGALMLRIGINRALWLFGVVQVVSILGFAVLADAGPVLWMLAVVISFEYLGVGLGTAAFTAFIARETSKMYAATQFALFTALAALPRTFANASTGVLVEQVGWTHFFLLCAVLAIPGMLLLLWIAPWNGEAKPSAPQPSPAAPGTPEPRGPERQERTLILHAGMHKTGSSAIQDYLFEHFDHPEYEYVSAGMANSSLMVLESFKNDLGRVPVYRAQKLPEKKLGQVRERARQQLTAVLQSVRKPNAILSAESISLFRKGECVELREFLAEYFGRIRLVLYVRPVKSRVESAFQERLKTRYSRPDKSIVVNFRQRISVFDEVFGRENVTVKRYDRGDFPGGSVVRDFLGNLGLEAAPEQLMQSNESLSLPAVQLLYVYRKFFPHKLPGDDALLAKLSSLDGGKFRMHSELVDRCVLVRDGSLEWLQERAGINLNEASLGTDKGAIKSESDLFDIPRSSLQWLEDQGVGPNFEYLYDGDIQSIAWALRAVAESDSDRQPGRLFGFNRGR